MEGRNSVIRDLRFHQLLLPGIILSSRSPSTNNTAKMAKEAPGVKFYPTGTTLFVTQDQILASKPLQENPGATGDILEDFALLKNHSSPITCIGFADEKDWLLCTCTDEEVILFKQDALLKTFNSITIAEDLGRILSCALIVRDDLIFTCAATPNELVLIQGTSVDNPLTEFGLLDLTHLETVGNYDRVNEPITRLRLAFFQNILHVIGIATGNVVSLKMWEVSAEGAFKLRDHRMASQSKTIAGVDFVRTGDSEDYILVIVSPEGHTELFSASNQGFCLLSRIKLEEFPSSSPELTLNPILTSKESNSFQCDFRIFSVRFFCGNLGTDEMKSNEKSEGNDENEIEELDNSLTVAENLQVECPKILICIATTNGILIVNLRSGEVEFIHQYPGLFHGETTLVSNAKISTTKNSPKVTVALQLLLQQRVCTFQLQVEIPADVPHEGFTFFTTKELEPKSILRKKLKSPPPYPTVKKGSHVVRMSQPVTRRSISHGGIPRFRRPQPNTPNSLRPSRMPPASQTASKGFKKPPIPKVVKRRPGSAPNSPLPSARAIRITPKSTYNGYDQLSFSESGADGEGCCLATRLHDPLSHMRMTFTSDGNVMAVGGNVAPMIVFKTTPVFEPVCIYKDSRRITALDFSFCNSHHLLVATNDGRTEIVNWKQEKQLLSLQFNSKFNEHSHAQYYFLDKFILQPEDNRIVLYSFRIATPNSITRKAGTLLMNFQQITALAAPNRFYSNIILCGGSNKCLTAFDADTEQEVVTIPNAHSKPITCIRLNEAPKGPGATFLSDLFLTASNSSRDPIKIWDLRIARCVTRIADVNSKIFVPTSRPAFSACGRYIASGFEENEVGIYDIRQFNSRVASLRGRSSVLNVSFDPNFTMLWFGCRNGNLWNFNTI